MQTIPFRVAAIHDLSGFGRTSLTVVIPVLSSMGIQVCPLPTAVLSTHTVEYTDFTFCDLTDEMPKILEHWKAIGLHFEAIYSGFMASCEQMSLVAHCIEHCLAKDGLVVVDPVLGDNGILDPTMTPAMVKSMQELVTKSHIVTPNLTELAFLLDKDIPASISLNTVKAWLKELASLGPRMVVVTSVPTKSGHLGQIDNDTEAELSAFDSTSVVAFDKEQGRFWYMPCQYIPAHYPGTGDTFTSVLLGALLQGDALPIAIERAVHFVSSGIRATFGHKLAMREGILLERVLPVLQQCPQSNVCQLLS